MQAACITWTRVVNCSMLCAAVTARAETELRNSGIETKEYISTHEEPFDQTPKPQLKGLPAGNDTVGVLLCKAHSSFLSFRFLHCLKSWWLDLEKHCRGSDPK